MERISQAKTAVHHGRDLAYSLRNKTPAQRAAMAAEDGDGALYILKPTIAQRAKLFKVSPRSLAYARALPPAERILVAWGDRPLIEPQDRLKAAIRTDAEVERFIVEIGPDRVYRALDAITAPMSVAAE